MFAARNMMMTSGRRSYRAEVIADSTVAYWRLGEASGTTAADEMATYAGTYVGSPTLGATGAVAGNTAMQVTGTQYVTISDAAALRFDRNFTFEWWEYKAAEIATGAAISKGSGAYLLRHSGASIALVKSGTAQIMVSTANLVSGSWNHVALTVTSGGLCTIYINGVDSGSTTTALTFGGTNPLRLGQDSGGNMIGTLDEVACYATALSAARILAHYNAKNNS